ncbi:death ligand signal enhancer [Melanotaenia boesemani]|uniref:death ligand signal enhancer n=1 Tax=Melanotaenia boesemani TaxID=1250792 RepID=UPI001C03C6F3|nr:death ligand signal enhancer [Melanotaenia boesemani]
MWRVQGFFGRVLHRYHGSSTLRLPQNHHVEDEVINSSAALSTSRHSSDNSSQREEDGGRRKKQRNFQFGYADEFPRYSALDAVGWGAVAVLLMQICRRIHSRFSSGTEPSPNPGTLTAPLSLQKCGYRILLEILSRQYVLPRGRSVLCLQTVPESQKQGQFSAQNSSSSSNNGLSISSEHHLTADSSSSDHQGELLSQDSLTPEESQLFEAWSQQNEASQDNTEKKDVEGLLSDDGRLGEAALKLRQVGSTSVPVILNIIGLENVKSEKYEEAFICFLAAAQQGYNKAQFNAGVCYDKGRGVGQDKEKALYYYRQAAAGGHKQAKYCCAKLLLTSRGHQSVEKLTTVISLLEEAAAAGLTKAQLCLASVYSRDPERYGCKSVQYLKMAAESGDDAALLFLGQCYERGFGVQQNLKTAGEFYKQAAQAGNKHAKSLLMPTNNIYSKEDAVMRSIRSAPCFSVTGGVLQQPLSSLASCHSATLSHLPHSWSTSNLGASFSSTPLHLHPPCTETRACQWTVGIG